MKKPQKRPNIVFILTDQQSAGMMSCAGNKYLNTPAMDSLARNGIRFDRAYCTNPVCVPSRISLMTGRYPSEVSVRSNYNGENVPIKEEIVRSNTLGAILRRAGYETAYGGKIHLPPGLQPDELGFETISTDKRDKLADDCAAYIKRPHEKPFFLYASFINPHDICLMAMRAFAVAENPELSIHYNSIQCETLDKALELPGDVSEEEFFASICPPLPPNYDKQEDEPEAIQMVREQRPFKKYATENWGEKEWRMHRWAYCKLTEMVDRQIAKVLFAIKESGQEENTVVIFTSDHGDHDSSHRLEHKSTAYEECSRVPLIISHKGKTLAGTVNGTHLVSNGLDLLPTLCDYAGIEKPVGSRGLSLKSLAEGMEVNEWRRELLVENEFGNMIVTNDHKYVLYFDGENREQLHDLKKDPFEMRNCANDKDKTSILEKHRVLLNESLSGLLKLSRTEIATAVYGINRNDWKVVSVSLNSPFENEGHADVACLLNDDPAYYWHTYHGDKKLSAPPHEVVLDMNRIIEVSAFTLMTCGKTATPDDCEFYLSNDGKNWNIAAKALFTDLQEQPEMRLIKLDSPMSGRFLRFVAKHAAGNQDCIKLAGIGAVKG